MKRTIFVNGMMGLGDNIYQRAFLKQLPAGSYIKTPWPELYIDLPVHPVKSGTCLRTQRKNECISNIEFHRAPAHCQTINVFYGANELRHGSIFDAFRQQFRVEPAKLDLPAWGPADFAHERPIAVIRPATVRAEWRSDSRNPEPEYMLEASRLLMEHFCVISVADLQPGEEWCVGEQPEAHLRLHAGELNIISLMRLISHAAVVVTPVGWALPAAIAYNVPVYVIAGGRGAHNAPEIITDPTMDLSTVGWAIPDNYCRCTDWKHKCDKHISNFSIKFEKWLYECVLTDKNTPDQNSYDTLRQEI